MCGPTQDRTVSRLLPLRRRMTARVLCFLPVTLADLLGCALFRLAFQTIRFLAAAVVLVFPWHRATSSWVDLSSNHKHLLMVQAKKETYVSTFTVSGNLTRPTIPSAFTTSLNRAAFTR